MEESKSFKKYRQIYCICHNINLLSAEIALSTKSQSKIQKVQFLKDLYGEVVTCAVAQMSFATPIKKPPKPRHD